MEGLTANSPKRYLKKISALLAISFILAVNFVLRAFPQQDVSEFEKRLTKISEEIKELKARIGEEEKKESTILSSLDKISFNKNLIKNEIALHNVRLEKTNLELSSLRKNIPELKAKLEKERQAIEKMLLTIYKFGKFSLLQFVLQAENIKTLFSETKYLTLLAQYQENVISEYRGTLAELGKAEEQLETKKKEISQLIEGAHLKSKELEEQERKNKALILEMQKNKKTYEKALEELKERAQQLQLLIKKLEKQEVVLPSPFIPLYEKKGKLPWPVSGKIITFFGLQRHPQFNTTTMNNGIEISPQKSDLIVNCLHPGKVVYTDYFQGYGNLIIIDHGMTYYSLYGHCSEFLVNKGDLVRAEQPIAVAGDSGSLSGVTLYLEIRYKTKPLNPLQWLKRR